MDKKLTTDGKGIRRPISIKMQEFKCLIPNWEKSNLSIQSYIEDIMEELENLAVNETINNESKLLIIKNPKILDDIAKSCRQNKEITLVYERLEIKEYLNKLEKGDKAEERRDKENSSGMEIESIYIVEPKREGEKYMLVVNEDYKHAREMQNSHMSKTLIKIIKNEEHVLYLKKYEDYYNFSLACPIYYDGKYKRTKVLVKKDEFILREMKQYYEICSDIKTKILTHRQYINRLQRTET